MFAKDQTDSDAVSDNDLARHGLLQGFAASSGYLQLNPCLDVMHLA
jgi:hypothetical protein